MRYPRSLVIIIGIPLATCRCERHREIDIPSDTSLFLMTLQSGNASGAGDARWNDGLLWKKGRGTLQPGCLGSERLPRRKMSPDGQPQAADGLRWASPYRSTSLLGSASNRFRLSWLGGPPCPPSGASASQPPVSAGCLMHPSTPACPRSRASYLGATLRGLRTVPLP